MLFYQRRRSVHITVHIAMQKADQGVDAAWFEQVTTIWALVVLRLRPDTG